MIRTEDWKLVYVPDAEGGGVRLFDLRADPGELQDLAGRHPERVAELRERLDPILAADTRTKPDRELSEADLEQLRELGYAQ